MTTTAQNLSALLAALEAGVQAAAPLAPLVGALNLPVVSAAANVASELLSIAMAAKEAYATGVQIMAETDAARLDALIDQLMAQAATETADANKG